MADEAKADLDEAMPALEAALDSLKALNKVSTSTKPRGEAVEHVLMFLRC